MKIDAIIFDKDGVLVDSEEIKATAWQQTLNCYNVEGGFAWYLSNLGSTSISLAEKAINTFNLDEVPNKIAYEWYQNYFRIKSYVKPIKQNLQLLSSLANVYLIGVASSMDKATIEAEMLKFGYREYIQICVSGEDVTNNKPAPDIYLTTAKILQVEPFKCIAIEDSPTGIRAAKTAGMFCIGFKNSLYDLDLSEADIVTQDLTQINFEELCIFQ